MWFKVDDTFALHPKVLAAGNAAIGLWIRAGAWSAGQLTDGYIPDTLLSSLGATKQQANALVKAGLWDREPDGYRFHDWPVYQPMRTDVEAAREAGAERVRRWRSNHTRKGTA